MDFLSDLSEEFKDFIEDFLEELNLKKKTKPVKEKEVVLRGKLTSVRPAYVFAERIESLLKVIIGSSIIVSAIISSVWGITRTSALIDLLITTYAGRFLLLFVGFSYFVIGIWKLAHLKK